MVAVALTDDQIIDDILRREGGFVNDPADAGGATRFGVTIHTLSEARGRPATVRDVAELGEPEAREILRDRYIVRPGFDKIESQSVRAAVVDAAVNHGVSQATRSLQRVVGVREDGVLGPLTLDALTALGERAVLAKFAAERVRLYARIVQSKPEQVKFLLGWMNRVADFIEDLA